jgi:hypothetical protein
MTAFAKWGRGRERGREGKRKREREGTNQAGVELPKWRSPGPWWLF